MKDGECVNGECVLLCGLHVLSSRHAGHKEVRVELGGQLKENLHFCKSILHYNSKQIKMNLSKHYKVKKKCNLHYDPIM